MSRKADDNAAAFEQIRQQMTDQIRSLSDEIKSQSGSLLNVVNSMKDIVPHMQETSRDIALLHERSANVQTDVDKLYKIVYEGDSRPSLISQLTGLSDAIANLQASLNAKKTAANSKWAFWTAVVVAAISSITAIILGIYKSN